MDRRWFLGAIGSVFGAAVVPAVVGKAANVVVSNAQVITDEGPAVLLHQLGFRAPKNGQRGFAHGCIWQHIQTSDVLVNVGSAVCAQWAVPPGNPERFLKMVLTQRLSTAQRCKELAAGGDGIIDPSEEMLAQESFMDNRL